MAENKTPPTEVQEPRRAKWRNMPDASYVPNVIPLIDVLFLLLLFFLLGTRLRQMEGDIPGSLPKIGKSEAASDSPPVANAKEVEVTVRSQGEMRDSAVYEMGGVQTTINSPQELFEKLQARQATLGSADVTVIIKPTPGTRWRFVVEAYNAAMRAQFKSIGFASLG